MQFGARLLTLVPPCLPPRLLRHFQHEQSNSLDLTWWPMLVLWCGPRLPLHHTLHRGCVGICVCSCMTTSPCMGLKATSFQCTAPPESARFGHSLKVENTYLPCVVASPGNCEEEGMRCTSRSDFILIGLLVEREVSTEDTSEIAPVPLAAEPVAVHVFFHPCPCLHRTFSRAFFLVCLSL